ncbi:MAG: hypothetical protein U0641_20225 [Anaerolineae bacterium]
MAQAIIHPTAEVSPHATLGEGVKVWKGAQVREAAVLGDNVIVGKDAYIVDFDVRVGANCKSRTPPSSTIGDSGGGRIHRPRRDPDQKPRAARINPDGRQKSADDWEARQTVIRYGASVGAGAVIGRADGRALRPGRGGGRGDAGRAGARPGRGRAGAGRGLRVRVRRGARRPAACGAVPACAGRADSCAAGSNSHN